MLTNESVRKQERLLNRLSWLEAKWEELFEDYIKRCERAKTDKHYLLLNPYALVAQEKRMQVMERRIAEIKEELA